MEQKLDPVLKKILKNGTNDILPVIVQTIDGLTDEDRQIVNTVGGRIKDDLKIINSYSADLSADAVSSIVLSPRVKMIYYDSVVQAI